MLFLFCSLLLSVSCSYEDAVKLHLFTPTICRRSVSINVSTDVSEKSLNARYHGAVPAGRESIPGFHERQSSNSGDTAPGQTNGDGLFGMWFVTTPNLSVQGGGSTSGGGADYQSALGGLAHRGLGGDTSPPPHVFVYFFLSLTHTLPPPSPK